MRGQDGTWSQVGLAVMTSVPAGVGAIVASRKPAWPSRRAYSSRLRSRPPVMSNIVTSTILPGAGASPGGITRSTTMSCPVSGTAVRTVRRARSQSTGAVADREGLVVAERRCRAHHRRGRSPVTSSAPVGLPTGHVGLWGVRRDT